MLCLILVSVLLHGLFQGCTTHGLSGIVEQKLQLHIQANNPERYKIQVPKNGVFSIPSNGILTISYSTKLRSREVRVLGDAVLMNHSSFDVTHFLILKDSKTIRKVKTEELFTLEKDAEGYSVLKLD